VIVDVDRVIDEVATENGLDDFGDPSYRDGLDRFVAALRDEASPNEVGQAVADAQIRNNLAVRLRVEQWWKDHPQLRDERIEAPVFIVGMSRSGTTALSHLLARDPANRSLLGWEASSPVPPPDVATYTTDPRFEAAKANEFGLLYKLNPDIAKMHHDPPDMPVECIVPLTQHLVSLSLPLQFWIPTYGRWVNGADHGPAYRWHERVLRLLQSGGVRGRWQLKSPQHAIAIEALTEQYPDARFIVTHRDPATCAASTASLGRAFTAAFGDRPDALALGGYWTDTLAAMGDGLLAYRRRHGDERFVDVAYRDLTADPVGTAQRIYDALGEPLSLAAEGAMRAHATVAVQNRYGKHEYDWQGLGLDRSALDERFSAYSERFAEHLA
jgi:hypothetical protein